MDTCTSPPAHVPTEPWFQRAHTHDAQTQAASLSSWQQHYEQLGAGRFEGLLEDLRFDQLQVFRETTNRSVLQDGSARSGHVTVGLADFEAGRASFCGHHIDPDTPIGIQADVPFQLVTAPRMTLVGISIPSATLQALAAAVDGPEAAEAAWQVPRSCVLRALGPRRLELQRLTSSALALGVQASTLLGPAAARRTLGLALADAMLQCFRPEHVVADLPICASSRQRIVRLARDYMQAHAESVITVPDLCEAAHTSRRALQYAFEDLLQVSPITYLRCMRLNRARRDLLRQASRCQSAGASVGAGVGDVAARWGFWHLSRFAAEYRTLFGELPSATLGQGKPAAKVALSG